MICILRCAGLRCVAFEYSSVHQSGLCFRGNSFSEMLNMNRVFFDITCDTDEYKMHCCVTSTFVSSHEILSNQFNYPYLIIALMLAVGTWKYSEG